MDPASFQEKKVDLCFTSEEFIVDKNIIVNLEALCCNIRYGMRLFGIFSGPFYRDQKWRFGICLCQ